MSRVVLTGVAVLCIAGSCERGSPLGPAPGLPQYQTLAVVPVPGGTLNVAGGNLLVSRTDLSIDTRLGTHTVGATYNSAAGAWLWNFDVRYDGQTFLDPSGALFDVTGLAPGAAIPGSVWVVLDGATLKTRGGMVHEFDAAGRLAATRWSSSQYPRLLFESQTIAGAPHTTAIHQCTAAAACAEVFDIAYDAGTGRVKSIADRAGRLADFAYDASGRLIQARDGLDTARGWAGFRYGYSGDLLTEIVNSENERVVYAYLGGRLQKARPNGEASLEHLFAYHAANARGLYRTEVIDPLLQVSQFWYDALRRVHRIENPLAEATVLAWSENRVARRTLPSGAETHWTYADDDVASELQPSGNLVTYAYEPDGANRRDPFARPILRIEDDLGLVEERSYDAQGHFLSRTNGAGDTFSVTYGPDESVASTTTAAGLTVALSDYGEHGHPTTIGYASGQATREYDAVGNLLSATDALASDFQLAQGGVSARSFDEDRNVASLELSDLASFVVLSTQTITIDHRSDGRISRIARPYGGDTEFVYNAYGWLVERREKVDGAWSATTFEHDALGRRTARERPNGMRREIRYDPAGRIATLAHLRDGVVASQAVHRYSDGLLTSIADSTYAGSEDYFYDSAGRVSNVAFPGGEVLSIGYDERSRKTWELYELPGMTPLRMLEFGYDGADRETSIREDGQLALERIYSRGRLAETRYGSGLVRSYSYDAQHGMLAGSTTTNVSSQLVEDTVVDVSIQFGLTVPVIVGAETTTFGSLPATTSEEYQLFPGGYQGNSLNAVGKRVGWFENRVDGVFHNGPGQYNHDELSNLLGSNLDHGSVGGTYNAEHNRLLSLATVEGNIDYVYDEAGCTVSRGGVPLVWTASGRISAIGTTASFVWDTAGRPVSSDLEGVATLRRFGGRVEGDAVGAPVAIDLGEVRIDLTQGERLYRHHDFRGNVKFLSDAVGQVVAHYLYEPYGVDEVLGADADPQRFAHGIQVGDLVILGERVYDPLAARFLSPDPVYQLINQYTYTLGNPIWFGDRTGRTLEGALNAAAIAFAINGAATAPLNPGLAVVSFLLSGFFALTAQYVSFDDSAAGSPDSVSGGLGGTGGVGGGALDPLSAALAVALGAIGMHRRRRPRQRPAEG